jgi:cytosine/adenosine deaminase-related metal-dependent hydrolase
VRVLPSPRAVERATRELGRPAEDLGDGVLAPAYVDAHAHLELSGLHGRLPRDRGFAAWIGEILNERRRMEPDDYRRGVESGARRLLETGTSTVGDIASTEAGALARRGSLRSVVYREVLDAWNTERTKEALRPLRRALPARAHRIEGVSPHAPYTTSDRLLAGIGDLVRRRPLRTTVHWSETRAEVDWLRSGTGEFAGILPNSPRKSGLDLLAAAGLLGESTSLVHGNHPGRGEAARLAKCGVVLIHCPGTHTFFGRPPFPWATYRRARVPIALGTDSSASNEDLDMGREMALARASNPALSAGEVFAMATTVAARALGLSDRVGALHAGSDADVVLHRLPSDGEAEPLEALTSGLGRVAGVWLRGRQVHAR